MKYTTANSLGKLSVWLLPLLLLIIIIIVIIIIFIIITIIIIFSLPSKLINERGSTSQVD